MSEEELEEALAELEETGMTTEAAAC